MKPLKLSGTPASVLVQLTPSTAGSLGSPTQDAHCRISASPLPFPFLKNSGAPTPPPASGTTPVTRRAAALAEAVTEAMTEADGTLPTSGGRANAQVVRAPAPQHLPPPALVPRSRFAARSSTAQNDKVGRVGAWGGGVGACRERAARWGASCLSWEFRRGAASSPNLLFSHNHTGPLASSHNQASAAAFAFTARIGRSPTSEVWRAVHLATGLPYAIKTSTRPLAPVRAAAMAEAALAVAALLPATHPNLVATHAAWEEGGRLYLQMDLCGGGSVGRALRAAQAATSEGGGSGAALPEPAVWRVAADGAAALAALAAADGGGVLHLDVSPDNLFLGYPASGPIRLGDFGLAVRCADLDLKNHPGSGSGSRGAWEEGDGRYVAPEVLGCSDAPAAAAGAPGPPADVFSLGATLWHLLTGVALPRGDRAPRPRPGGPLPLPLPGGGQASPALGRLLAGMLHRDPACRPTAAGVAATAAAAVAGASPAEAAAANAAFAAATARRPSWGGDGDENGQLKQQQPPPSRHALFGTARLGVAASFELTCGGNGGGAAAAAPSVAEEEDGGDPALVGGCVSPVHVQHSRRRTPLSAPPSPPAGAAAAGAGLLPPPPRPAGGGVFFFGGAPLGTGLVASRAAAAAVADLERSASAMSIDGCGCDHPRGDRAGRQAAGAGAGGGVPGGGGGGALRSTDSFEVGSVDLATAVRALSMSTSMSAD